MKRAFGNILYALRMKANFTQADLAERAGLSQAAVSRLEKGQRWPNLKTMKRISQAFNTTVKALMHLTADEIGKPDAEYWDSLDDDKEEKENE